MAGAKATAAMRDTFIFAFFNGATCLAIAFVCLCRLNAMHIHVLFRVRLKYACFIGAAIVSGLKPLWGEWPDWGSLGTALLVFIGLTCSGKAWFHDQVPPGSTDFHELPAYPESER